MTLQQVYNKYLQPFDNAYLNSNKNVGGQNMQFGGPPGQAGPSTLAAVNAAQQQRLGGGIAVPNGADLVGLIPFAKMTTEELRGRNLPLDLINKIEVNRPMLACMADGQQSQQMQPFADMTDSSDPWTYHHLGVLSRNSDLGDREELWAVYNSFKRCAA